MELTKKQITNILHKLEDGEYEESQEYVFEDKTSAIKVIDEFPISIYWYFKEDSAKCSTPTPSDILTVTVGKFKFVRDASIGERWRLDSDIYEWPNDEMTIEWDEETENVSELLSELLDYANYSEGDVSDAEYPSDLWEEWTEQEVIDEIESQLNYDEYIELGGKYYCVEKSIDETIKELAQEIGSENADYKILTKKQTSEAAIRLIPDYPGYV